MNFISLRFKIRCYLGESHIGHQLLKAYTGYSNKIACSKTKICLEGYPRSGNSFLFNLVSKRVKEGTRIAHHVHVPSQIEVSIRSGAHCFVLIREPSAAIASAIVSSDMKLSENVACQSYLNFYQHLLHRWESCNVIEFEEIINHTQLLLRKMSILTNGLIQNCRFESHERDTIFKHLDSHNRKMKQSINLMARPSRDRDELKQNAKARVINSQYFGDCQQLYELIKMKGTCLSENTAL